MGIRKSELDKYKLKYEKGSRKFRLSPTFGKKQPWIFRVVGAIGNTIKTFFSDFFSAIKQIIKEIM
jgi:hypothetical protein